MPVPKPRTSSVAATSVARSSAPVGDRVQDRDARGAATGQAALRVGIAPCVAAEDAEQPHGQRARDPAAQRHAAQPAQQLVRVDGRGEEHRGAEDRQDPQAEHDAVDDRLDRDVELAEPGQVPAAEEHGRTVAGDERVDDHHGQRERDTPLRGPAQFAPEPGGQRGAASAASTATSTAGCSQTSGTEPSARHQSPPTPARVACSGLRRERGFTVSRAVAGCPCPPRSRARSGSAAHPRSVPPRPRRRRRRPCP